MILALFLIVCLCVSDVYNFGIDFNFGPQTESVFEDYEETAKLLGFRNQDEPKDEDDISPEPDIKKQSPMNIEIVTSKIVKAPMKKFVYFTIPKLNVDDLKDDDDDNEDGDEQEDISFEEFYATTTAATEEDLPILQEETNNLSLNAEEEQDIKSELTASDGITYKSNPLHFILQLTCLLILCHHR